MKILTIISLLGGAFVFHVLLLKFYSSGPEAIIVVPITIVIYLILSVLAGHLVNSQISNNRRIGIYLLFVLIIGILISSIHPTDGGIKPIEYAIESLGVQLSKDEIEYREIYEEGKRREPYKQFAVRKYRAIIPDRAFIVHYYLSEIEMLSGKSIKLIFEKRNQEWRLLNLSDQEITASIEETLEDVENKKIETFKIRINGDAFIERYYPSQNSQDSYFQSLNNRWKNGKPRVVIYEWSV